MYLGVVVNSYPGRYESASQQQGDMNVLAQILEAELQSVSQCMLL